MSSSIEAEGHRVLGIGKKHANKTFHQIYAQDPQYVSWALSEPRNGALKTFADWCQKKKLATPTTPVRSEQRARTQTTPQTMPRAFTCPVHKCAMRGPFTVKNGEQHNIGRQFYSCRYNGSNEWATSRRQQDGQSDCGVDGFKWADGSDAFSASSCRRAEEHFGMPHDSIGVGVSTPLGNIVGDELSRGSSGFQGLERGGVLVNPQLAGKRRRPAEDDLGGPQRRRDGGWRCPPAPPGQVWVQDAEAAHFNDEPFLIDEDDIDANYCAV